MNIQTVLIVCSGNLCRSPIAEGLLKGLLQDAKVQGVRVHSAGTLGIEGEPASAHGIEACEREKDIDIGDHRSKGLDRQMIEDADLIFCMAARHLAWIHQATPDIQVNAHLLKAYAGVPAELGWDVSDPVGMDYATYRTSCLELADLLETALPRMREDLGCG